MTQKRAFRKSDCIRGMMCAMVLAFSSASMVTRARARTSSSSLVVGKHSFRKQTEQEWNIYK